MSDEQAAITTLTMRCTTCGCINWADATVCQNCGNNLVPTPAPTCEETVRPPARGSAAEETIRALRAAGGQASNRDIGMAIGVAAHRVSGYLCSLERKGLVVRLAKGHRGKASEWKLPNDTLSDAGGKP